MILTHDQITANHGACLAILRNALGIGCFLPHIASEAIKVVEEMQEHDNAVRDAMQSGIDKTFTRLKEDGLL